MLFEHLIAFGDRLLVRVGRLPFRHDLLKTLWKMDQMLAGTDAKTRQTAVCPVSGRQVRSSIIEVKGRDV
jgi:hypothetical protein